MSWVLIGIPIGIILLYFGSEWMVDGAKKLALRIGITPFAVGLTVVAMGSSSPEVITSLVSGDNPQIILGNIVGSNIANICLAIGLAAVISPIMCKFATVRFELLVMVFAVALISVMALTGSLGVVEGMILLSALVLFVILTFKLKKGESEDNKDGRDDIEKDESHTTPLWKCLIMVIAGVAALYFGARLFIDGAVELALIFGVSDLLIGLLVVAVGTFLPELCICLMAAYRKENEIVVSNIIGSVIFNSFFALGIAILFTTIPVTHYAIVFHMPVMVVSAIILLMMIRLGNKVSKVEGMILITIYLAYVSAMIMFPELTQGVI